ncbi:hypothetical protein ACUXST_001556 [Sphingomonas sp. F9_3S_D5_B_2]
MRASILVLPLLLVAAPVRAQPLPPLEPQSMHIPPAAADRVADALDAVTDALLDLPVGRLQAAVEGRPPSPADRHVTVRDIERRNDPDFDRKLHRHIADARPLVRQSIRAVDDALPEMMHGLQQASRALERATANLPDPTYPKR